MFIAALFIMTSGENNPSVHQQKIGYTKYGINIQWNIIKPLKGNAILIGVMTWMDFENIMFRKIIQKQKNKYCMIPFT